MDFNDLEMPVRLAITGMNSRRRELAEAFRTCRFVYGTQGSNVISKVIGAFVDRLERNQAARSETQLHSPGSDPARLRNVFDPGFRAKAYVHGGLSQMMDLYYGQYGTTTYLQRNELIGEFVHRAMKLTGNFQMRVPGYKAYWDTFGEVPSPNAGQSWHPSKNYEGWEEPPPGDHPRKRYSGWFYPNPDATEPNAGMSATKYMSRVIRAGIMYFGGTLIYDGAEVYYESVFSKRKVRDSDTAMEARALLPFLTQDPGKSRVAFGNGTMIFQYFGQECAPTRKLFKENWIFTNGSTHRHANSLAAFLGKGTSEEFSDLWALFPENLARNPSRAARLPLAMAEPGRRVASPKGEMSADSARKVLAFARRMKAKRSAASPD